MRKTHGKGAFRALLLSHRRVYVQCNNYMLSPRAPLDQKRMPPMITRVLARLALIARRLDSAWAFADEMRTKARLANNLSGLSAAATTRW